MIYDDGKKKYRTYHVEADGRVVANFPDGKNLTEMSVTAMLLYEILWRLENPKSVNRRIRP